MDLTELNRLNHNRHPWEVVRAEIVWQGINKYCKPRETSCVLDVGCGDCFFLNYLKTKLPASTKYYGVDLKADAKFIESASEGGIQIYTDANRLLNRKFKLILLMDVLEHTDNDREFLQKIVNESAESGSIIVVTAPAFNMLMSSHDEFLKHKRRYRVLQLDALLRSTGLKVLQQNYFFWSLLIVRFIFAAVEKLSGKKISALSKGAGGWKGGRLRGIFTVFALKIDFAVTRLFAKIGWNLPGLSLLYICEK